MEKPAVGRLTQRVREWLPSAVFRIIERQWVIEKHLLRFRLCHSMLVFILMGITFVPLKSFNPVKIHHYCILW